MGKCNFCVSTGPCVEKTDDIYVDMLYIIIPNFNSEEFRNSNICQDCDTLVTDIFNFKSNCLELEDSLYNYRTEDAAEIDLEKLVGLTSFCKEKLCRACLETIDDDSFVDLNFGDSLLKEYKRKCLSDLNFFLTKDPVLCIRCANMLEKYFIFLERFETNEKTVEYNDITDCRTIVLNESILNSIEAQQRLSDNENDTEIFDDVKEEISIEEHVLESLDPIVPNENSCSTINVDILVEENKNCDNEVEIVSNNNNTKNDSQLVSNQQLTDKSDEPRLMEIDSSASTSINNDNTDSNKRKRTPVTSIQIDDSASSSEIDSSSIHASENSKRRKSKRLVATKKNYYENDSDFNPELESESDSDYDVNADKNKKRNKTSVSTRSGAYSERESFVHGQGWRSNSGRWKSIYPGIIRSNPLLAALLTDSDSDSVDSDTDCLLKSLLATHPALPDPRKSNLQKFTKIDQNFLVKKLALHPALPEPSVDILKRIAETKSKRNLTKLLRKQRKKTAPTSTRSVRTEQSNGFVRIAPVPGQSNQTTPNTNVLPPRIWMYTPASVVPSNSPAPVVPTNLPAQTAQTQYFCVTSTTSANVPPGGNFSLSGPIPQQPAPPQTLPHISETLKNIISEFLKDKYSKLPHLRRAFDQQYPAAGRVSACIDLTADDPNQSATVGKPSTSAPVIPSTPPTGQTNDDSEMNTVMSDLERVLAAPGVEETVDARNGREPSANDIEYRLINSFLSNSVAKDVSGNVGVPIANEQRQLTLQNLLSEQNKSEEVERSKARNAAAFISTDVTIEIDDQSKRNRSADPSTSTTKHNDDGQPKRNFTADPLPSTSSVTADITTGQDDNQSVRNRCVDSSPSTSTVNADVTMEMNDNQLPSTAKVPAGIDDKQPKRNLPDDPLLSTSAQMENDDQSKRNCSADLLPSTSTANVDVTAGIDDNQSERNRLADSLPSTSITVENNQSNRNSTTFPLPSISTVTVTTETDDNRPKQNCPADPLPSTSTIIELDDKQPKRNRSADPLSSRSTSTVDVTMGTDDNQPKRNRPGDSLPRTSITTENDGQSKKNRPADVTTGLVDNQSVRDRRVDSSHSTSTAPADVTIELDSDDDTVNAPKTGIRLLATSRAEMRNMISQFSNEINAANDSNGKVVTMALNNHLSCPYELAIFKCDRCAYNTRFFRLIEEHCARHFGAISDSDSYACRTCSERFAVATDLSAHLQREHAQFFYTLWFWCVNCTKPFQQHVDVVRHNKRCSKKDISVNLFKSNNTVFCMICYFETDDVDKARTHTKTCMTRRVAPVEVIELE